MERRTVKPHSSLSRREDYRSSRLMPCQISNEFGDRYSWHSFMCLAPRFLGLNESVEQACRLQKRLLQSGIVRCFCDCTRRAGHEQLSGAAYRSRKRSRAWLMQLLDACSYRRSEKSPEVRQAWRTLLRLSGEEYGAIASLIHNSRKEQNDGCSPGTSHTSSSRRHFLENLKKWAPAFAPLPSSLNLK